MNRVISFRDSKKEVSRGCPQGSPLSPLLWNIFFNTVLEIPLPPNGRSQAYADDLCIMFKGKDTETLVRQANETMDKICTWAFHRKIKFNTNKTQACIFHSRARMKGARLIFDNIEIPICNYIKVLGITLDRDLTFIKHINETTNKLVNIIPRIKNCANA